MIQDTVGAFVPNELFTIAGRIDGPLAGLTFAAKDLFDVAGRVTGAGNPTWAATHSRAERSSPIIDTLLEAGATLVGKTITDELAFSLQGDNIHYGSPTNIASPDRVTGGSSSGSAAAVAARLVDFALGTDTGGSIRVPASYCGIWGLRTTHDTLSRDGLVPLHPSYDTPGWFAHDAETFLRVGEVLCRATDYAPNRTRLLQDVADLADPCFQIPLMQVRKAVEQLVGPVSTVISAQGKPLEDWRAVYATSGGYEGWQIHGDWITQHKPIFAPAIAARWRAVSEITDVEAEAARAKASIIRAHIHSLIDMKTIAILPSAASPAPLRKADPKEVDDIRLRTMAMTCVAGIAGLPQINMPFQSADGSPIGISLMGPQGSDLALIKLAAKIHDLAQTI